MSIHANSVVHPTADPVNEAAGYPFVVREQRALRVLMCRRCAKDTGIPGAMYCDPCRPLRVTDALMSDVDWERAGLVEQTVVAS